MVEHPILVRGIGLDGTRQPRPVLLGMRDSDFPARLFADLGRSAAERLSTASAVTRSADGYAHLLQPVQRTLQVAMIDLACDTLREPRLGPRRIESAGLVVRRIAQTTEAGKAKNRNDLRPEAWMRTADGKYGWAPLNRTTEDLDPDPSRRPGLHSGQAGLDQMLRAHLAFSVMTEVTTPAFVAPPEVCERLERTIVYALIPTASSEVADQPPSPPDYSDSTLQQQLPPLLRAGSHRVPFAGKSVDHRYMSVDFSTANNATDFLAFVTLLQTVALAFGAFTGTAEANAVIQALNRRAVTFADSSRMGVGDFLAKANHYLLEYDPGTNQPSGKLLMPDKWEDSTADDEAAVLQAVKTAVRARSSKVVMPEGRYQDHTRLYKLRIFARVRGDDGCPPKILWSPYSEEFEIAPWYESAGVLGPPVPLPNPNRKFLQATKPNISFVVPDSLMKVLQSATLKKMSDGSMGPPSPLSLSWICGFNIPIITICAFIVLNIFLSLLNIVFFWLPFVKICIPIPAAAAKSQGGE